MDISSFRSFFNWFTTTRYGLVLLVIIFISFLFPNKSRLDFEFELGGTWNYEDLFAPQTFNVKTISEVPDEETNSTEKESSLHYVLDTDKTRRKQEQFAQIFQSQLNLVRNEGQFEDVVQQPGRYLNYGKHLIEQIYDNGVIEKEEQLKGQEENLKVLLHQGNRALITGINDLYSPEQVELLIGDSLFSSGLKEAEFLFPLLKNLLSPNIHYNDSLTRQESLVQQDIPAEETFRMIRKGEVIVRRGALIDNDIYQKLLSFQQLNAGLGGIRQSKFVVFLGYFLLTSLSLGLFLFYLQFNAREVFDDLRQLSFMMMWFVVYSYLVYSLEAIQVLSAYVIPFCIVPIVIKIFFNERLALFTHIVLVLIASILSFEGYEFTFLQLLAGIVVVLSDIDIRNWTRFFTSIFYIFLAYALGYLGLSLIQEGNFTNIDWSAYRWLLINVILTMLAYPLIPLLERIFGFVSAIKLVELSDMNQPLLKEMSIKAPGTLQHSLQVANLSEAAAAAIGADPLLVKVAALYHDIGKIKQPYNFIENQSGENPHDQIDELESARIIIGHVTEGEQMAHKAGLPPLIINFIRSHHGTTRVEYFYRNFVKKNPERQFDESLFHYPGPRPQTKEETILMMADSLEAASKSLKNPKEKDINDLVDNIIAGKITHGQFLESALTFHELDICVEAFKKLLKSINHIRIEYPK